MATINDIEKLNPDLMTKSVAELERRKAEIEMALERKRAIEDEQRRAALIDEARSRIDVLVDNIKWLHENSFLAPSAVEFFSVKGRGTDLSFNPSVRFKKPV